jgi:predicted N-acetyltransferase YhbS
LDKEYYPRYGFKPAGNLGFDAPYPIPEKNAVIFDMDGLMLDSQRTAAKALKNAVSYYGPRFNRTN